MVSFGEASRRFFERAFDFQGRSPRAEYWWAYLMMILVALVVGAISGILGQIGALLLGLFYIVIIIPSISIVVRRLHDTDRSGWWLLLGLVPLIGLVLLVFFCMEGTKGENKYGPDPYGGVSADVFS